MSTINEQLTILEETKQLIKQAIINKGQPISINDSFRSYANKINNITVKGSLYYVPELQISVPEEEIGTIFETTVLKSILPEGLQINDVLLCKSIEASNIGTLESIDVLNITESEDPTMCNLKCILSRVFDNVMDTSDGDVISSDIAEDKVAYSNGKKVVGNLFVTGEVDNINSDAKIISTWSGPALPEPGIQTTYTNSTRRILSTEAKINSYVPNSKIAELGNITGEKIVKGNTIYGVVGSFEENMPDEEYQEAIIIADDILGEN